VKKTDKDHQKKQDREKLKGVLLSRQTLGTKKKGFREVQES